MTWAAASAKPETADRACPPTFGRRHAHVVNGKSADVVARELGLTPKAVDLAKARVPRRPHQELDGLLATDADLKELYGLSESQGIGLIGTQVTERGVADLKKALPKCKVVMGERSRQGDERDVTAKPFDPTLKALVETEPESWPALIGSPTGPTRVIDADIATVSGAADKVLHVAAHHPYLLHLEFLSGHDATSLPRKLHVRNGLLEDRHDLPVRSGVVVLRPAADSPRLNGVYERAFPGEPAYLTFRYQVVRVWQLAPGPLLTGGLGLLPLAPISAVTEAELPGIIGTMRRRLAAQRARRHARGAWAAAYILSGLRYSPALAAQLFREVTTMKESATYQAILAEGREEGLAQGEVREARKLLRLLGDDAFGPPDAPTAAALDRIEDLARLEHLLRQLRTARNWADLLAERTPTRRPARQRPS